MSVPRDVATIGRIVERALILSADHGTPLDRQSLMMDLTAADEAVGLRLDDLAGADDVNFAHDVFGIHKHLNRETRRLEDGFMPRFARHA